MLQAKDSDYTLSKKKNKKDIKKCGRDTNVLNLKLVMICLCDATPKI